MTRPVYERPPIDEVVCDATISPLEGWRVTHMGAFWAEVRDRFPKCEHAPPLDLGEQNIDAGGLPLPRVWLITEDEAELIQLQRNRVIFNWRRRRADQEYIGYERVRDRFLESLTKYGVFLRQWNVGALNIRKLELAYINMLAQGQGWESMPEIGKILPAFAGLSLATGSAEMKGVDTRIAFAAPNFAGSLHMHFNTARRIVEQLPVLRIEIRAVGSPATPSPDAVSPWLDQAHDHITEVFNTMTSEYARTELWGRR